MAEVERDGAHRWSESPPGEGPMTGERYPYGQIHVESLLMCREVIREASGTLSFFRVFGGIYAAAGDTGNYLYPEGDLVAVVSGPADHDFDASPLWIRIIPTVDPDQSFRVIFNVESGAQEMVGLIVWTSLSHFALWSGSDYEFTIEAADRRPLATTSLRVRLMQDEALPPPPNSRYIRWSRAGFHSQRPS